jgi:hypothetical protein
VSVASLAYPTARLVACDRRAAWSATQGQPARMGHNSMQAAIIYQHATTEADARIAAALDAELSAGDDVQAADEAGPDDQPG